MVALVLLLWALLCVANGRSIDKNIAAAYKSDTTSNGDLLVEYDMVYPKSRYQRKDGRLVPVNGDLETRKATTLPLWTGGVIPYKMNPGDFTNAEKNIIRAGMRVWQAHTCLTFREATATDDNFLFFKNDPGCNSYVGMNGGSQQVSLDPECRNTETVIHEVGHALGFEHEHQRPDRDRYITVLKDNLQANWTWALDKMEWEDIATHNVPYDYSSIMHYSWDAFAKDSDDGGYMLAIRTRDPKWQYRIGIAKVPSFYDFLMVNKIYECAPANCPTTPCRRGGYRDGSCVCQCKGWPVHPCDDGQPDGGGFDEALKCKDDDPDCDSFKSEGYCSKDSDQYRFMFDHCSLTCGFC